MTNVGLGVGFPYVGEVRTPRTHRWSIGLQRELPGFFLVEGTYVGSFSEHIPVSRELNSVPGQYFSTSPVRDDATNNFLIAAGRRIPFAGLLPGTNINGANVARSQLLRPVSAVHGHHRARDQRHVRLHLVPGPGRAPDGQRLHGAGRLHLVEDDDRDRLPELVRHRSSSG